MDGFRWQLNKKYKDFIHHHPDFINNGGTISLFAHSLGSVLSYDLMYETCEAKGLINKRESLKKIPTPSTTGQPSNEEGTVDIDGSTGINDTQITVCTWE